MEKNTVAQAIIGGPINDTGQLALALVINRLAGEDGWAVSYRKDLAKACRMPERTFRRKVELMVAEGLIEKRKKPTPGLRLTGKALDVDRPPWPLNRPNRPSNRPQWPLEPETATGQIDHSTGHSGRLTGQMAPPPSPSAYLPKRYKDLKEEDKEKEPPSSSTSERVLIASSETPKAPRLDQPAAQPPAIVEQAQGRPDELLPANPKRKRKRAPVENPKVRITEDWQPKAQTLANLVMKNQIPREFCGALVYEFVTYWSERGTARPGWDSTFITHAKSQWKREQEHAERAEASQKYTDASGKPISEASYLSRENARRVIADMASGVLDDFDLDTPV